MSVTEFELASVKNVSLREIGSINRNYNTYMLERMMQIWIPVVFTMQTKGKKTQIHYNDHVQMHSL